MRKQHVLESWTIESSQKIHHFTLLSDSRRKDLFFWKAVCMCVYMEVDTRWLEGKGSDINQDLWCGTDT